MKITNRQLRRIIKEEIATVNDDAIEDAVMGVLSDEGGAAGLDPIEDALEDLEDDDISLPDEDIEDIIVDVTGVKRHADGDFIDTTQLEGKTVKITKRQLKRIIKEEMALLDQVEVEPEIHHDGVKMVLNQLDSIAVVAAKTKDLIEAEGEIPEWVQSKVATIQDRLNSVASYLLGKTVDVELEM